MVNDELIEGFFVEDEEKFNTEKVVNLINRVKKYGKLIGKNGQVQIEDINLTDTDKTKIFLIVRYLGSELAKLKPELGINNDIAEITTDEFAKFIDRDKFNAGARMSALVKEGFATKLGKGKIKIKSFMIEKFIKYLENRPDTKKKREKSLGRTKKTNKSSKASTKQKNHLPTFNEDEVYQRLSKNLNISEDKLRDVLFFIKGSLFKFDDVPGKSKRKQQTNCILLTGYTLLIGFGEQKFKSTLLSKICFESSIDISDLKYTLRDAIKSGYLTKAGTETQDNIMKGKGKQEAIKVFKEMCS